MSEDRKKLEAIFNAALELTGTEREIYLARACADDAPLRQQVEKLLQALDRADGFLTRGSQELAPVSDADKATRLADRPIDESDRPTVLAPTPISEGPGTRIGRYKLLQQIGEGGMGVVYMAEQEEPVRRRVALKVIKLGMDTKQVVARFEAERQALALMDHPNIASVLDGGATDTGRPYFVMELVQGVPITEFCDKAKLSAKERLKLFMQVCQAIQSAHQKGIIHRDIKPSNVLVTLHDGVPVPKVIDFGIAKATNQKLTEKTLFTNFASMIGTPAYMSPEQAEMSGLDIDTRTDIYALGVLLYALLTGTTPFPEKRLRSLGYGEMQRVILEEEPERPSTRLSTMANEQKTIVAKNCGEELAALSNLLKGDLDWIVMKCLEKDRQRRYETANGLASDIQRFLGNEPVLARPPSAAYRVEKFARRHRTASVAAALITLALLIGVTVATWALIHERAAREREQATFDRANQQLSAAKDFVKQVFDKVAPEIAKLAGAANAQESLTQSGLSFVQRLQALAGDDPALRASLARLLIQAAEAQDSGLANTVGDYAKGLQRANEAISLLRGGSLSLAPSEHARLLYLADQAAIQCLYGLGKWDEGVSRSQSLEAKLDELEQGPGANLWARERRINLRLSTAAALDSAGRHKEAIEQYLQPFLASERARSIGEDSTEFQLRCLICANDNLTSAHAFLKEFDAMLPCANEAVRIAELLVKRFPRDARYAAGQPYSWSMQGYAMLRTGSSNDGVAVLAKARREIERLISIDSVNDLFRYIRAIIAANQSLAFAGWSEENVSLGEREKRLSQAQTYFAEAEEFNRAAKAKEPERFIKAASVQMTIARAKLAADKNAQAKP
ncbi:MAG: serine/threonine protein kinase [Verrucomicrobia bacterium]|nr:serine/threonine protein kinase [Verrucomicrobiota bacterium]